MLGPVTADEVKAVWADYQTVQTELESSGIKDPEIVRGVLEAIFKRRVFGRDMTRLQREDRRMKLGYVDMAIKIGSTVAPLVMMFYMWITRH